MKREPSELINNLTIAIRNIAKEDKLQPVYEQASKHDIKHYIQQHKILQILQDSVPLNTLSVSELYHICLFLSDMELFEIKLTGYFTDDEITEAVSDKRVFKPKYNDVIEFEKVLFNGNEYQEEYICMLDYSTIGQMDSEGVFSYNYATQRKAKIVKIRDRIERIADVNMESVKAIAEKIKNGSFHMNTITLNMRVTGEEYFNYVDGKLIIDKKKTIIDAIDGYHRIKGINMAWRENPRIEGKMIVMIKHLSTEDARAFIAQEFMGNTNHAEEMRLYDPSGVVARLVALINKNNRSKNIFRNNISIQGDKNNILMFDEILSKNIREAWFNIIEDANSLELNKIAGYICGFYEMVYDAICNKFKAKDMDELRKINSKALDMMFMSGFLYIAAKWYTKYGECIDNSKLESIIDKIDFESDKYTYADGDTRQFNMYKRAWLSM